MVLKTIAALASAPSYVAGAHDAPPFSSGATPEEAGADLALLPRDLSAATPSTQMWERRRLGGILGRYIGYDPAAMAGDESAQKERPR